MCIDDDDLYELFVANVDRWEIMLSTLSKCLHNKRVMILQLLLILFLFLDDDPGFFSATIVISICDRPYFRRPLSAAILFGL